MFCCVCYSANFSFNIKREKSVYFHHYWTPLKHWIFVTKQKHLLKSTTTAKFSKTDLRTTNRQSTVFKLDKFSQQPGLPTNVIAFFFFIDISVLLHFKFHNLTIFSQFFYLLNFNSVKIRIQMRTNRKPPIW